MSNATNKYNTPKGLQQPAAADLSDGTTGSGAVVLAGSPTLTTAVLGSSTATTQSALDSSTKVATREVTLVACCASNEPDKVVDLQDSFEPGGRVVRLVH